MVFDRDLLHTAFTLILELGVMIYTLPLPTEFAAGSLGKSS